MKLENQVCTLEQSIRLELLGVEPLSVLTWHAEGDSASVLMRGAKELTRIAHKNGWLHATVHPAFTVAELATIIGKDRGAELLKNAVERKMNQSHSFIIVLNPQFLADVAIELLESGEITAVEVNARLSSVGAINQ